MNNEKFEHVGNIGVDSGVVMLGDPCYIRSVKSVNQTVNSWGDFCHVLRTGDTIKLPYNAPNANACAAIVTHTAYGDGVYPVFIKRSKDGAISELLIKFTEE